MTMEAQRSFNVDVQTEGGMSEFTVEGQSYEPSDYEVEGDWSSASFLLAGGALAGSVELTGLKYESIQADAALVEALRMMGADVSVKYNSIAVERSKLNGISFPASQPYVPRRRGSA
jgi:3-phosphoshikimate 1-carboxyvinyltransferase